MGNSTLGKMAGAGGQIPATRVHQPAAEPQPEPQTAGKWTRKEDAAKPAPSSGKGNLIKRILNALALLVLSRITRIPGEANKPAATKTTPVPGEKPAEGDPLKASGTPPKGAIQTTASDSKVRAEAGGNVASAGSSAGAPGEFDTREDLVEEILTLSSYASQFDENILIKDFLNRDDDGRERFTLDQLKEIRDALLEIREGCQEILEGMRFDPLEYYDESAVLALYASREQKTASLTPPVPADTQPPLPPLPTDSSVSDVAKDAPPLPLSWGPLPDLPPLPQAHAAVPAAPKDTAALPVFLGPLPPLPDAAKNAAPPAYPPRNATVAQGSYLPPLPARTVSAADPGVPADTAPPAYPPRTAKPAVEPDSYLPPLPARTLAAPKDTAALPVSRGPLPPLPDAAKNAAPPAYPPRNATVAQGSDLPPLPARPVRAADPACPAARR